MPAYPACRRPCRAGRWPRDAGPPKAASDVAFPREEDIRLAQDLLFFAYRDFTNAADVILEELGLGRAHHRALHFIGRNPGITVSELLAILRITKQSLARVLGALVEQGYVAQAPGREDRRQRLLTLTPAGQALERRLFERQRRAWPPPIASAGAAAVDGFRRVMQGIMDEEARRNIAETHGTRRGHATECGGIGEASSRPSGRRQPARWDRATGDAMAGPAARRPATADRATGWRAPRLAPRLTPPARPPGHGDVARWARGSATHLPRPRLANGRGARPGSETEQR